MYNSILCAIVLCINLSIFVLLLGACCINCMLRSINNTTHTRWRTGRQLNLTKSSSNYVYKFTPCHILFFSLNSAASLPVRFTQSATLLSFTCFDTLSLFLSALHWLQSQQKKMCGWSCRDWNHWERKCGLVHVWCLQYMRNLCNIRDAEMFFILMTHTQHIKNGIKQTNKMSTVRSYVCPGDEKKKNDKYRLGKQIFQEKEKKCFSFFVGADCCTESEWVRCQQRHDMAEQ